MRLISGRPLKNVIGLYAIKIWFPRSRFSTASSRLSFVLVTNVSTFLDAKDQETAN
jgi:hypothetical protein